MPSGRGSSLLNVARLLRAGWVLAQHGVRLVPDGVKLPLPARLALAATWPVRILTAPFRLGRKPSMRIARALSSLGPSYIKLGQFLATRGDIIGPRLAADLSLLQDRMPPFSAAEAKAAVEEALGGALSAHFETFGPPVAAASIAQVHKATTRRPDGTTQQVAVKILRPGVERRFRSDLESFYFAARLIERFHVPSRRLKPIAVVDNLRRTTELELDLRLEAAAISEMADNIASDTPRPGEAAGFRVPTVDWRRTQKRVLTLEWIDGIPISDRERLKAAGFDLRALGLTVLRSFLTHAMRDGFFHADMHQGNLLVDPEGRVVAVDFGIMGRLGPQEQRFLAEILHGLITRDYRAAAAVHFEAGYVPSHHSIDVFAQAMRAIGEPIHGRTAAEISMADLLGQLFAYTEVFDMETRPELILLQKSMVIVEGVARSLDPNLNLWSAAEPVAREWMEANLGMAGRLKVAGDSASEVGRLLAHLPGAMKQAERAAVAISEMAQGGVRLSQDSVSAIEATNRRSSRLRTAAILLGAASLVAMAVQQLGFL